MYLGLGVGEPSQGDHLVEIQSSVPFSSSRNVWMVGHEGLMSDYLDAIPEWGVTELFTK